jgi:TonB family protein
MLMVMILMLLAQDTPYRIANGVSQPTLIHKVEPAYSKEAEEAHLQGTVELQIVVRPDGISAAFKVMKSLGLGLDEKAIEAVRQWRFGPGKKDGVPVPVIATVQVNFVLGDSPAWRLSKAVFDPDPGTSRPTLKRAEFPKHSRT